MSYKVITANETLVADAASGLLNNTPVVIEVDTTSAAITVTLPLLSTFTFPFGITYIFHDYAGTAATNNITIAANAANEINNAANVVINTTDGSVMVTASGLLDWTAVNTAGGLPIAPATATAAGLTTGTIVNGNVFVPVTCDDANKIVILPAPIPGTIVKLLNGATGYELRSNSPTTVAINGGTGSAAESAIGANIYAVLECVSATAWIGSTYTTAGVKGVVEVAAP